MTEVAAPPSTAREHRRSRRVLIAAGLVVLLGALAAFGYLVVLDRTLASNLKRDPSLLQGLTNRPAKPTEGPGAKALNYLLIGSDGRFGSEATTAVSGQRSDTIMIAHVTAKRDRIYLISFPRDLYVDIPGRGKNKINAAFAFGGAPLLAATLEQLTSVRIDHVAAIDFQGFRNLTTLVGGVQVTNSQASSSPPYSWPAGPITIEGDEALAYVRQRDGLAGGDLDRVERQQQVVKAILGRGLSRSTVTNPAKLLDFIGTGASNITVDASLGQSEIRSTALSLRGIRGSAIQFLQAPITGFGRSPEGASIDVLDTTRMAALSDAIRNDDIPAYLKANPARTK